MNTELKKALAKIQERHLWRTLMAKDHTIGCGELEADGRKRLTVIRALLEQGYLAAGQEPDKGQYTSYTYTSKAWDELEAMKPARLHPSLDNTLDRQRLADMKLPYAPFMYMDRAEQKYVLEHPETYTLVAMNDFDLRRGDTSNLKLFVIGANDDPKLFGGSRDLYVTCKDLQEALATVERAERLDYVWRNNLDWGLRQQGLFPQEAGDSKVRNDGGEDILFGGGGRLSFGKTPEKWAQELEDNIESAQGTIAKAMADLQLLIHVRAGIQATGGWSQFLTRYEAALVAEMAKEDAAKTDNAKEQPAA